MLDVVSYSDLQREKVFDCPKCKGKLSVCGTDYKAGIAFCDAKPLYWVDLGEGNRTKCGGKCRSACGPMCDCVCRGENHGCAC